MPSTNASLDAASTDRKARLAKLASLKRKQPPQDESPPATTAPSAEDSVAIRHLSGRNYDLETRGPKLGFENAPIHGKNTLEDRAMTITEEARNREEEKPEDKPLDLFALQPKKPNWDLKRDLAKKMSVLDRRTENAIARIVLERVEGQTRKEKDATNGASNGLGAESANFGGVDLVETIKVREREEAEKEQRLEEQALSEEDE